MICSRGGWIGCACLRSDVTLLALALPAQSQATSKALSPLPLSRLFVRPKEAVQRLVTPEVENIKPAWLGLHSQTPCVGHVS